MVFECSAIILIILILSVLILRSGSRSGWGVAVLPLLLVPLTRPPLGSDLS